MAKNRSLNTVNINNRVFERVKYTLEQDFEIAILANSKKIFDDKLLVNFKLKLKTGSIFQTDVKADMLMIDADYSRWWVVEVERIKSHLCDRRALLRQDIAVPQACRGVIGHAYCDR